MRALLSAALVVLVAPPAFGQSVTLTKDDGRPLIVGAAETLGDGLQASDIDGAAIAAEFRRLCLPVTDGADAEARVGASPFSLQPADATFPAEGRRPAVRVSQWRGASAALSTFSGDGAGLRGRPVSIPSRGATTTGPYGPFRASGTQCTLVVAVDGFDHVAALTAALNGSFGTPAKLVEKRNFADGHWLLADGTRIDMNAPVAGDGPQAIHLSARTDLGSARR